MKSINKWTDAELAAQCIMPRLNADKYFEDKEYKNGIIELARRGIGGFCIFGGSFHQLKLMTNELQGYAEIPLIFSADFENGLLMRLRDGSPFPHAMALGQADDTGKTREVARAIAREAKFVGVHWNLAPVCDINSNPRNPVINIRAFGNDADKVIRHAVAYIEGLQLENVLACAKHFPGHGDTEVDSHLGLPVIEKSLEEFKSLELKPFAAAIECGVKSVMPGHLAVPAIDPLGTTASLSKNIIGILKENMSYSGLVITDALDMKPIRSKYSSGESAINAFKAGADVALLPENPLQAVEEVTKLACEDTDFREMLRESAGRIIDAKRWSGITTAVASADDEDTKSFANHEKLALVVAHKALDISGNKSFLPIPEDKTIAGFAFVSGEDIQSDAQFFKMLTQGIENDIDLGFINLDISEEEILDLTSGLQDSELFFFSIPYRKSSEIKRESEKINRIIQSISRAKPVIAVFTGNPHYADNIDAETKIFTYSNSISSLAAAVIELSGRDIRNYE